MRATRIGPVGRWIDPARAPSASFDCSRKRWRVSRTSRSVEPETAERGSTRSVGRAPGCSSRTGRPGPLVAAVGTGADDVAVRQEPLVGDGVDLLVDALLDEAVARPALGRCWVSSWFCGEELARSSRTRGRSRRRLGFWSSCCSAQNSATASPASRPPARRACRARRSRR